MNKKRKKKYTSFVKDKNVETKSFLKSNSNLFSKLIACSNINEFKCAIRIE